LQLRDELFSDGQAARLGAGKASEFLPQVAQAQSVQDDVRGLPHGKPQARPQPQEKQEALRLQAKLKDLGRGNVQGSHLFGPSVMNKFEPLGNHRGRAHGSPDQRTGLVPGLVEAPMSPGLGILRIKATPLSTIDASSTHPAARLLPPQGPAPLSGVHTFINSHRRNQRD